MLLNENRLKIKILCDLFPEWEFNIEDTRRYSYREKERKKERERGKKKKKRKMANKIVKYNV